MDVVETSGSLGAIAPQAQSPATAAQPPLAAAEEQAFFSGYLDGLDPKWRVVGWVRPMRPGADRLRVQLVEGGVGYGTDMAERFRGDLLTAQIGDGKYGFMLPIPVELFDGARHLISVRVVEAPGEPPLGVLDILLPSRAPPNAHGAASELPTGAELLRKVLGRRPATAETNIRTHEAELTAALAEIADSYDYATALGMLYIHVLRRRIDEGGLQSRLTRLTKNPDELGSVVREVLQSEEAQNLYQGGADYRFPTVTMLTTWTRLRRPN